MDDMVPNQNNQLTEQQFFASYPKGRKFHANRLLKDFFDCGGYSQLASHGADGRNAAALIIFIATQEDRFGYKGPISFWISQIQESLYMRSPKQPGAAIDLAVKSGWLAAWAKHKRNETYFYTINAITSEIGSNDDAITSNITSNITSEIGRTPYLIPSLIPFLEKEPNSKPKSACGYTTDFEEFWKSYPPLRRKDKKAAFEAWKKALKDNAKAPCANTDGWPAYLIQRASDYSQSVEGNGEYVKGPVPWLNKGCWDDSPDAWGKKPWTGSYRTTATNDDGGF